MTTEKPLADLGVVVIGRNEGLRLVRCLESLRTEARCVVYADSASSDGSPERARLLGCEVVVLAPGQGLNAAKGRNAGFARLLALHPALELVFFVDGDCRVEAGFLAAARAELERDPGLAAVCGRRRELEPERSLFNRAVDCEWNTPVGEAETFGGDVLLRVGALAAAGGYRESMNQGEDPELAFRLRRAGWRIRRIERDMTWHDVALHRLASWRRRHQRGGYAYAHGALLHWREPGRHQQRALASILCWGAALPLAALGALVPTRGLSLALLALYGLLWQRIRAQRGRQGDAPPFAARYAALITLGKIDEASGALRCLWDIALRRQALTVEYREPPREGERERAAA